MLTPEYSAGFFDGEGSVYAAVRKGYGHPTILVCISNTNKQVLELHKAMWGGSINRRKDREGWQSQYQWVLAPRMAKAFLLSIYPHLIVKKAVVYEALRYMEIQALPRSQRLDYTVYEGDGRKLVRGIPKPEISGKLAEIHGNIRRLNMRGAPHNARRTSEGER
jgi:hypothetical protein